MSWLIKTEVAGWSWRKGYGVVKFTVYKHYDRDEVAARINQYAIDVYRAKVTSLTVRGEDNWRNNGSRVTVTAELHFAG